MSKERVQAKLAFSGCLKPVESKIKRAQTEKDVGSAPQRKEDGENACDKGAGDVKRKRGALQQGCSTSAGVGASAGPLRMQPATVPNPEQKRSKKAVDTKCASQENPAKPNPVFALAARRCVAEANKSVRSRSALVDVTTPIKKPPQPDVSRRTCDISASLPPVHVLQGLYYSALQANAMGCPHRSLCKAACPASSVMEGNLQGHLQHESTVHTVATDVSKLLNDAIADFLWEDASAPATITAHGVENPDMSRRALDEGSESTPPDSPIAYMRTVLGHAGFQAYAHDASSVVRWKKQIACMLSNAEDFGAHQLPWTAKYAPQAAEQVLSNTSVSTQLRQWLSRERAEKTGPTETESCAGSSWKADSEDSEFIDSKASKRSHGPGGMLLTGPHGCGKSAAVYACAQELHMNVLEISPGMDRSGNNLVKLVGEATQSHTVVCKGTPLEEINQPNHSDDLTACKRKGRPVKSKAPKKKAARQSKPAKNSGPPQPEQRCLTGAAPTGVAHGKEPSIARSRSLLLFEDFDQLLDEEDDGFLASVSTLLLESKIPVFLLSERPDAEDSLQRAVAAGAKLQSARFTTPPIRSLLEYLGLVCACERVPVLPSVLMQLACACNGDLRSALNQLQLLVDHCSMDLEGPVEIDGPEEQSWKGCAWAVAAVPLAAPVSLSALHRAQAWQAQPHSLVWGLHEPLGSAARADPHSMDCSATEWACSLLVEGQTGAHSGQCAPAVMARHQPDSHTQRERLSGQQSADMVLDENPCDPSGSAKAPVPCSSCTAQCMYRSCGGWTGAQQCEREGGRILAAWAEHLRVKRSRSVKRRKRRRNAAANDTKHLETGGGKKPCRVLQGEAENQENPCAHEDLADAAENDADVRMLEDSSALELQNEAEDMQEDGIVAARHVLDDDAGPAAVHRPPPSASLAQLGDSSDDGEAQADPVVALDALGGNNNGAGGPSSAAGVAPDASPEDVPAGLSPSMTTPPRAQQVSVGALSSLPDSGAAPEAAAGSVPQEGPDQRPVSLNAASLVLKQAEAAQNAYIAHLQGLAAEMQECAAHRASESVPHASIVPAAEQGNAELSGTATDLDAVVKAAEATSAVEALAGRRVALLDRCVECVSTTEWLWDDSSATTSVTVAPVQIKPVATAAAGMGADSDRSGGVAMGLRNSVDAAPLDAVLQGVNESALACFAGSMSGTDGAPLRSAVRCSIPFRRGARLSGANVLSVLRPVLHCGTRSAAVSCARTAITMAADEYTVADELDDGGARRSRRQRQRGYCAELVHKFDFSLSQFSDAALGSSK